VAPEEISYTVNIKTWQQKRDAGEAARWLKKMSASAFKPNVLAFNAVISSFSRQGRSVEAVGWLDQMFEMALEPNTKTYTAVIAACANAGSYEDAVHWFEVMVKSNVVPERRTYNAVIAVCAKRGDVEGATRWLRDMRASGPQNVPNKLSYDTALYSCARASPPDAVVSEKLFREMVAEKFAPDFHTLHHLSAAMGEDRADALCSALHIDVKASRSQRTTAEEDSI
jgi:pentatricopeptide repeat protein